MKFRSLFRLISLCALPLLFPLFVSAQVNLSSNDISVSLNPESPGPHQQISVSIDSFATDLNAASIIWNVNGKKVSSGKGIKQINITTGSIGQKTAVSISISTAEGDVSESFSIIPSSIDLVWEAHTYTPPFFKGKPLFTGESSITFIAMPHMMRGGSEIPATNLIYKWSYNGTILANENGYGKNSIDVSAPFLPRPLNIAVEATDPQTGAVADAVSAVTPGTPFVLFYKNDPLYGVEYEHAIQSSYSLSDREIDITAAPYYFSAHSAYDKKLTYNWEINGFPISDGQNSPDKVFRQVGDAFGSSNISLSISSADKMFQTANGNVMINFTKPTTPSSF